MYSRHKQSVYEICKGKCIYCEKKLSIEEGTLDHFMPQKKGGCNHKHNLVLSCQKCNSDKSDADPLLYLIREGKACDERFQPYFDWLEECPYDNSEERAERCEELRKRLDELVIVRTNATTINRFEKIYEKYDGECIFCGSVLAKNKALMVKFLPLYMGGVKHMSNLTLCCAFCDLGRRNRHPMDYLFEQKVYWTEPRIKKFIDGLVRADTTKSKNFLKQLGL